MERISDKKKCMASLAVFRELYDSQKDIYDVISLYIKQLILDSGIHVFELQEMKIRLNDMYGFEIPSAVIPPALKRLVRLGILDKNGSYYSVRADCFKDEVSDFKNLSETISNQNQKIFDSLVLFVEQKKRTSLSVEEIENLKLAFCSFIIDDMTNTDYSELISAFLVSHKNEEGFINQLNQIKQGLIIYVGLSYNVNIDRVDAIDIPIHIYMETDVLFSMAGCNGILFQTLFEEFYEQVVQINKRNRKRIIHFRYFNETAKEIESYFNVAEQIVRGEKTLDPSKQAMTTIVKGCRDAYMVQEKYSDFLRLLKSKDIMLDTQEHYYDKEQQALNIEHGKFFKNKPIDVSDDDIERKLRLLNYINIKRGGKEQTIFRNIGHILLSANSLTFKIAFDSEIKKTKKSLWQRV